MAGRRLAVVVAVENYADKTIKPVKYAEADARGIANALALHGFDPKQEKVLLSAAATYATTRSTIRTYLAGMGSGDTLVLFYAGHGFAAGDMNFITCYDTNLSDRENTSIGLQWVFAEMQKSKGRRILTFLDSCHSGIPVDESMRDLYGDLSEAELAEFFEQSEVRLCFASCRSHEVSRSHAKLGHGIWTHHLITALSGNSPAALEGKSTRITSRSLQDFLSAEVERSLAHLFSTPVAQTPWLVGGMTRASVIADIGPILQARRASAAPATRALKKALFSHVVRSKVSRLSGFRKGHTVPSRKTSTTQSFIATIAEADLKEDISETINALRDHLKYKRRDMVSGVQNGGGTIVTPDFDYHVSVELDSENTSEVIWAREIDNFRKPTIVQEDGFNEAFKGKFDTITFQFDEPVNVRELIETLEDEVSDKVKIDYDSDDTYCDIILPGANYVLRVTDSTFELIMSVRVAPKVLLARFMDIPKLTDGSSVFGALPWRKD